jgi:hypothetical protein
MMNYPDKRGVFAGRMNGKRGVYRVFGGKVRGVSTSRGGDGLYRQKIIVGEMENIPCAGRETGRNAHAQRYVMSEKAV